MMNVLAYIALAVLAGVLILGLLIFLFLGAAGLKKAKKPAMAAPLNPEDRNLDWLRRTYPPPRDPEPPPDLEDITYRFVRRREEEQRRATVRGQLDSQYGLAPTPPTQAPNSQ